MAAATACVVQFPHPGGEHRPQGDVMPWNTGGHRRKFLVSHGRFVGARGRSGEGELVFWGEWEPPSEIVERWPREGRLPRVLHRPFRVEPPARGTFQNTDPWVFGERFLYSNCRQRRSPALRSLPRGSLILFGSTLGGRFCLDTVFVVASAAPWSPARPRDLRTDAAFRTCTARALAASPENARADLTLYRGATPADPVDGMFSFVPARRCRANAPRFGRPAVRLRNLVNAASTQNVFGPRRILPLADVHRAWESVREQVLAADLLLATHLETPPRRSGRERTHPPSRAGCRTRSVCR